MVVAVVEDELFLRNSYEGGGHERCVGDAQMSLTVDSQDLVVEVLATDLNSSLSDQNWLLLLF
jgi:hypothetical protein